MANPDRSCPFRNCLNFIDTSQKFVTNKPPKHLLNHFPIIAKHAHYPAKYVKQILKEKTENNKEILSLSQVDTDLQNMFAIDSSVYQRTQK